MMKKFKITKKFDKDLKNSIMGEFKAKKQKVDLVLMKEEFKKRYPDVELPPPKPKKKKKGKKGKTGKKG